jgi:hypothetical protein
MNAPSDKADSNLAAPLAITSLYTSHSVSALKLLDQHLQFLRARAVADDVAAERGYRSAQKKADLEKLGFGRTQQLVPALVIPICSVRGEIESYQLRPDTPRLNQKGTRRKYEMKSRSRMLLDFHPRVTRPRENGKVPLIADPTVPLYITEGIPKGDAAVSIGLCCCSMLGVFNFRGTNESGGKTALADWELVALNGRRVYIAFDSDVMEKHQVYEALVRIKALLESRGATVQPIYLQAGDHGEKVGLDDFVATEKAAGHIDAEVRDKIRELATGELRARAVQSTDDARPEILIVRGGRGEIIDKAEEVLVARASRLLIFQRAGEVVRIVSLGNEMGMDSLPRPAGNVQLSPISPLNLQEIFDRIVDWKRKDPTEGTTSADCPREIPAIYLARVGGWKLPYLAGIIEAPIMRLDGSILDTPGYDEKTGLFFHAHGDWPSISDAPTRADAEAALGELLKPFAEFPWVDDSRSVLVAGILTAIQRRLLESAPMFAFDAPAQRSGKSLLAESLGIIATGRKPAATGIAKEGDELRKAITSALRENQAIINLDNITRPLDSPDLARAITQAEYGDRALGANRMLRLPTNVLWTATGNNLIFHGDLPSRVLICRIDSEIERPEQRTFTIADLPTYLVANRKCLVAAALTILRAFHVSGRPRQNVRPWGGFDHWSREVREPLVWLGLPDPCATRERIDASDPDRELTTVILRAWRRAFGSRVILVREILTVVKDGEHDELKEAILMVAAKRDDSNQIDARRLGAWCSSKAGRVVDGLRLMPDRKIHRAQGWRVTSVSPVSPEPVGENKEERTHSDTQADQERESVYRPESFERREADSPYSPDSPGVDIEEGTL